MHIILHSYGKINENLKDFRSNKYIFNERVKEREREKEYFISFIYAAGLINSHFPEP